jgi:hypothetical protein
MLTPATERFLDDGFEVIGFVCRAMIMTIGIVQSIAQGR